MKKECKHKGKVLCIKCGYNVARLTMREIAEYKKYIGYKEIDSADLCEVAHTITAELCKAKGIQLDKKPKNNIQTHYTTKAQSIFNRYFDLLEDNFRN